MRTVTATPATQARAAGTPARTMVPDVALLPDVLPSERLNATGQPVPELRRELRRIPNARNVVSVLRVYVESFGPVVVAARLHNPFAWVLAFLLMGRGHVLFAILGHEAAHRLLFARRRANDLV